MELLHTAAGHLPPKAASAAGRCTVALREECGHVRLVAQARALRLVPCAGPPLVGELPCAIEGLQVYEHTMQRGPELEFSLRVPSVNDFFIVLHGRPGFRPQDAEALTRESLLALHQARMTVSKPLQLVVYRGVPPDGTRGLGREIAMTEMLEFFSVVLQVTGARLRGEFGDERAVLGATAARDGPALAPGAAELAHEVHSLRLRAQAWQNPLMPWDEVLGQAGRRQMLAQAPVVAPV